MSPIQKRICELMGEHAGDGCGPTKAAAIVNLEFDRNFTPGHVMNLWITSRPRHAVRVTIANDYCQG